MSYAIPSERRSSLFFTVAFLVHARHSDVTPVRDDQQEHFFARRESRVRHLLFELEILKIN